MSHKDKCYTITEEDFEELMKYVPYEEYEHILKRSPDCINLSDGRYRESIKKQKLTIAEINKKAKLKRKTKQPDIGKFTKSLSTIFEEKPVKRSIRKKESNDESNNVLVI